MRLARVICAADQQDPALDALVAAADLDVLQLDYRRQAANPGFRSRFAAGFLQQLRSLHKILFLDSRLHLVTNAGGGAVTECVESLSQFLCEHHSADLVVAVLRGENLSPRLVELSAAGIELVDEQSQTSLLEIQQPLLSAQVELGAGPLAAALAEDARIVVAGCYDAVAPLLAATTQAFDWSWDYWDRLANVVVAAHLASAAMTANATTAKPNVLPSSPPWIEVTQEGAASIQTLRNNVIDAEELQRIFLPQTGGPALLRQADVVADISRLELQADPFGAWQVAGAQGQPATGDWVLRATFADGFCSSALFELTGNQAAARAEQIRASLEALLTPSESGQRSTTIESLHPVADSFPIFVRADCRSSQCELCEQFIRDVSNFAVRNTTSDCRLVDVPLSVRPTIRNYHVPISRDAIDVSVDTRVAKEWT